MGGYIGGAIGVGSMGVRHQRLPTKVAMHLVESFFSVIALAGDSSKSIRPVLRVLVCVIFSVGGLIAMLNAVFEQQFHFKSLGSEREGWRMPTWFARPFYFLLAAGMLYIAFQLWGDR